jgi:hypothetical protein
MTVTDTLKLSLVFHFMVGSWSYPQKRLGWKGLPRANTSLLGRFISYGRKRFITLGPGVNSYKIFYFMTTDASKK